MSLLIYYFVKNTLNVFMGVTLKSVRFTLVIAAEEQEWKDI